MQRRKTQKFFDSVYSSWNIIEEISTFISNLLVKKFSSCIYQRGNGCEEELSSIRYMLQVRVLDRGAVTHIKVPLPLPLSWGRTVQPYLPPQLLASSCNAAAAAAASAAAAPSRRVEVPDLLAADWRAAGTRRDYQVVGGLRSAQR